VLIRSPATEAEFEAYYALRWKILREPWNQPPGSEKDEFEGEAMHLAAWDDQGKLIGVGRLHRVVQNHGQIRYMAVEPAQRGQGVGRALLQELEERAIELGILEITLHAREEAVRFYRENGYQVLRASHALFGVVPHFEMRKRLL
jgi:ribosomal protein S18 acetylase RimI-like enzyme